MEAAAGQGAYLRFGDPFGRPSKRVVPLHFGQSQKSKSPQNAGFCWWVPGKLWLAGSLGGTRGIYHLVNIGVTGGTAFNG